MAYTKTEWRSDTLITPARFRNLGNQYEAILEEARELDSEPIILEVSESEPTGYEGMIYHDEGGNIYGYNGEEWIPLGVI